jgi:hypothetical protein
MLYPYESGEKPCGAGVFGRVDCDSCGAINFVERVSFGGKTVDEAELVRRANVPALDDCRIKS